MQDPVAANETAQTNTLPFFSLFFSSNLRSQEPERMLVEQHHIKHSAESVFVVAHQSNQQQHKRMIRRIYHLALKNERESEQKQKKQHKQRENSEL
jgi:hypothetical protein